MIASNILTNETELDGPMDVMDNTSLPLGKTLSGFVFITNQKI